MADVQDRRPCSSKNCTNFAKGVQAVEMLHKNSLDCMFGDVSGFPVWGAIVWGMLTHLPIQLCSICCIICLRGGLLYEVIEEALILL